MPSIIFYNIFIFFYTLAIRLAALWNPKARNWVEGRKNRPVFDSSRPSIWMHCASLGEFEQGRPVLEAIKKQFPQYLIVLSFFSPSGYEIRKNYSGADQVIYLPADTGENARQLLDDINPVYVIWVKYEYWFHHIREIRKRGIPLILIAANFRKSQPFFKWYGAFWKRMLHSFSYIFVQDDSSWNLLKSISIHHAAIAGDTRFDRVITTAAEKKSIPAVERFVQSDNVMVCGSTWPEDEAIIAAYSKSRTQVRFILAPHEIKVSNIERLKKLFDNPILYSDLMNEKTTPTSRVLIIDNIGMLSYLYSYASIAYIGGGFNASGIHNSLEAAVYRKPMIWGPSYKKFGEARDLIQCGSAHSVSNVAEFTEAADGWLNNEDALKTSGENAGQYVVSKIGATKIIMEHIMKTFSAPASRTV